MVRRPHPDGPDRCGDRGFASVELVVAVGLSFLLLVALTNLVVVQYARGVVRAAADEGARAGARFAVDPTTSCHARASDVVSGTGRLLTDVRIDCGVTGGRVRADVTGTIPRWLPPVPSVRTHAIGSSLEEVAPR